MTLLVKDFPVINYVLGAVGNNWDQLLATFLLGVVFLYWYAVIAFQVDEFRGQYNFEGYMNCESLVACFQTHFDYGLTVNPRWGSEEDDRVPKEAIAFNISYFLFINLILTAMISGIIIDAFSAMRTRAEENNDDTHNFCFICSIQRDEFEKLNISFKKHISQQHKMWQYLWFRIYLEGTDPTEMTGQETYVYELLQENRINFYPIKKALAIEGRAQEKKDIPTLFVKVDHLNKMLAETQNQVNVIKKTMEVQVNRLNSTVEKMNDQMVHRTENVAGLQGQV